MIKPAFGLPWRDIRAAVRCAGAGVSKLIDGLWLQKAAIEAPARVAVLPLVLATFTALLSDSERLRLRTPKPPVINAYRSL